MPGTAGRSDRRRVRATVAVVVGSLLQWLPLFTVALAAAVPAYAILWDVAHANDLSTVVLSVSGVGS